MSISGASNITASNNNSTVTVYGPASILYGLSVGGNTGTTGSSNVYNTGFVLAGGNNITLNQSNNTISISGANSFTLASALYALSLGGNTGTTGSSNVYNSGFVLAGGNNVTFSQSNNTISIVGAANTASTFAAGISTVGNTAGTSGLVSQQLLLAATQNITLSGSVNGQSASVSIVGPASVLYAISVGGNTGTTGSSNISNSGFVLAGGANITLSQSNNSISIVGAAQTTQPAVGFS